MKNLQVLASEEARKKLPEDAPVGKQTFVRIVCPACGNDRPHVIATVPADRMRYYKCQACDYAFKVPERRAEELL